MFKTINIREIARIYAVICILMQTSTINAKDNHGDAMTSVNSGDIHYMGNIEAGNMFPFQDFLDNSSGIATLTTTHGVVIKPWLYTGLGAGFWFGYAKEGFGIILPMYADVRLTYPNRRWRPFFDMRMGTLWGGEPIHHFLLQPSVGIKFAIKDTFGIYLSVGTIAHFSKRDGTSIAEGLSLNLGFDF